MFPGCGGLWEQNWIEGLAKGPLGSKALRTQVLREVQDVLRVSEDSLNPCMALKVVQGMGCLGCGTCFEMGRLVDCWQCVSLNLGTRKD